MIQPDDETITNLLIEINKDKNSKMKINDFFFPFLYYIIQKSSIQRKKSNNNQFNIIRKKSSKMFTFEENNQIKQKQKNEDDERRSKTDAISDKIETSRKKEILQMDLFTGRREKRE